jgi:DNA-binding NarL/FixJ family response regulator
MISQRANGSSQHLKVMLVDDHPLVRQGVRSLIEAAKPHWTVCAEAADSEEAHRLATETKPDIVVVDIAMPQVSGVDLIAQLRRLLPRAEFLALTMHDSETIFAQALRAGARGYVLKVDEAGKIIDALMALSRHQTYFSTSLTENLLQFYLNSSHSEQDNQLTPRERQVVKLVAEGNSNKRIATILGVSIKTVETHRHAAMEKIGAKSTADIALYAARNALVQI